MLIVVRLSALSLLLLGTLLFGTLPLCLARRLDAGSRRQRAAVGCLTLFGGGVLLATCLVHLLHEARLGFEEALARCHNLTRSPETSVLEREAAYDAALCGAGILRTRFPLPEFATTCGFFLALLVEELVKRAAPKKRGAEQLKPRVEASEDLAAVVALVFSAVFEGFAAGFQHTELSTWLLYASLALHQYASAFALGMEALHAGGGRLRVCAYAGALALACPTGMAVAIAAHSNLVESGSLQIGLLNAVSVGMLLHAAFYEMLRQRRDLDVAGFVQLLILALGFGAMSTVEYFYTRLQ